MARTHAHAHTRAHAQAHVHARAHARGSSPAWLSLGQAPTAANGGGAPAVRARATRTCAFPFDF